MTTAYSNLLGLALPTTGELSGTWGDTVNDYITKYLDDAIANAQIISGSQTAVTLSKTTGSALVSAGSGATGSAQYALIRCTGNPASTLTITVSYSSLTNSQFSKTYLIFNSTSTSQSVVVQGTTSSGTSTGVTIASGERALIAWNGTDFVKIATQSGTGEFVTVDTTNLEVTNIKAKDGTAAATIADSTGVITVSTQLNVDNLRLDGNTLSSTDSNGNVVIAPNGTGDFYVDADTVRVGDSNANATITTNGTGDLILNTNSGTNSGAITIEDGVNGNIIIAPNGTGQVQITNAALDLTTIEVTNIKAKDGTAAITIADSTGAVTVSTLLNVDNLRLDGNTISSTDTNGNITLAPNGTGDVYVDADTLRLGDSNADATLTTNGTGDLILNTNSGTNSGSITIADGANGNITIATNGTGVATFSTAVTMSATTQNIALGTSQTSGTFTVGGAAQTGTQTIDQSTKTHTLNIGTGAVENGATKTVNIGTGGVSGGTTAIAIGDATATTTITLNGTVNATTVNVTTLDLTNLEVTNIKAKDGTAAMSIADSTGVVSITANPVLSGGTANGVLYLNASKVATSGSALTFDGTNFGVNGANTYQKVLTSFPSTYVTTLNIGGQASITNDGGADEVRFTGAANASGFFDWYLNASEQMRLTSTGLHLGTSFTSISNRLQVAGNVAIGYTAAAPTTGLIVAGNVGIGTDAPKIQEWRAGTYLTVANASTRGQVEIDGAVADSGFASLGALIFTYSTNTTNHKDVALIEAVSSGSTANQRGASLAFFTKANGTASPAQNMTLDSSGNLGLGVTPSAWSSSFKAFDVGSSSAFVDSGTSSRLLQNAYVDSAGQPRYKNTAAAALYGIYGNEYRFYQAASGTAGNAITFTQAMTLDASGRLGIGATSVTQALTIQNSSSPAISMGYGGANAEHRLSWDSTDLSLLAGIANGASSKLIFGTAGTERARITSGGNFLLQTDNSSTTAGVGVKINASATAPVVSVVGSASTNADPTYLLYSTGAAAYRFYVDFAGNINATNTTITGISDQRLKENIRDLDVGLDAILALKPRKFDWKAGKGKDKKDDRGFVAQEFEQVFPDLVDKWLDPAPEGEEPYKSVRPDLIPVLVKAIQEQQAMINELKAEVAALKGV